MQHRDGFTLIELLVVIAIISLLVSILLPSLHKAKELATSLLCQTHLKALGTGFNYYMSDWDGYLPPVNAVISYNAQSKYLKPYGMVNCLGRYFDHPEWEDDWYNFGAIKKEFRSTVFVCPVKENAEAWKSGYCESVYLQEPGGWGANNPRAWAFPRRFWRQGGLSELERTTRGRGRSRGRTTRSAIPATPSILPTAMAGTCTM